MLPRCSDPPERATLDCTRLEHADEVASILCPRIVAIQSATCSELANVAKVADLMATGNTSMPILRATANVTRSIDVKTYYTEELYTGLYKPGLVHPPHDLAALLVHLASDPRLERHEALRFVSTNSNNGWAACLAAAYLARTHDGAAFHGLAVNGLKTEWATVRNIRILLERLNLSWRSPEAFDAAADAALMTYHPHVRNSLTPTAFAKAATLLPVSWVGLPPPFDVCLRFGDYSTKELLSDVRALGGWCRTFAYHGRVAAHASDIAGALEDALATTGARTHPTEQAGPFVVIRSSHMRSSVVAAGGGLSTRGAPAFAFVNKTPPAAKELYSPGCIQDMAGCDWHRGVPVQ